MRDGRDEGMPHDERARCCFRVAECIAWWRAWLLRKKGGAWHAVGALWPATQFYYNSTVLPAIADRRILAAFLALPLPLMAPLLVIALAIREVLDTRGLVLRAGDRFSLDQPPRGVREILRRDGSN